MNRFACIYVGANLIEIITAQRGRSRKIKILDRAFYDLEIGQEINQTGYITSPSIQTIKSTLQGYLRLAKEINPDEIRVIFSREISHAQNFVFVYYQLAEFLGNAKLIILNDTSEMELFCTSAHLFLSEVLDISRANLLMASICGESIEFALTNEGLIDFTAQIPYGYFKLSDMINTITSQRTRYSKLLSEIIENKLRLAVRHIGSREIDHVSLTTKDARVLASIYECKKEAPLFIFSKDEIDKAYKQLKELTPEQINSLFPKLTHNQSTTIQSTVIVARQLMSTAKTSDIYLIQRDIALDNVSLEFNATKTKGLEKWLSESALVSALALAKRYLVDIEHVDCITDYALHIFESLKKRFNLTKKIKFFLTLACSLIDVGQYGGEEGQAAAAEAIILRERLIGLTEEEQKVLAKICWAVKINAYDQTQSLRKFSIEEQLIISQVTAILKTATSLDQSRRKKVVKLSCSLSEEELVIKVTTTHNFQLESFYFNRDALWMQRIFNITPILKVKRIKE